MKKFFMVLLIIVVVIAALFIFKDSLIKFSVEKGVELFTGLKLNMGTLHVGVFKPVVDIKDVVLLNPSHFPDKTMVDIPEVYVHYDLPSLLRGKIYLPEVRFNLKEFVVVKNGKGELNLDALKNIQTTQKPETKSSEKKAPVKMPDIKIDLFQLKIGQVIYKDYSKGSKPDVKEFKINLNETYRNIDNPYVLANLIVAKALMNTTIASLTNFNLKGLQGTVGGVLSGAKGVVTGVASTAQEAGKKTVDAVKGLFQNTFRLGK